MKIEIGESLMLSYLKHVKKCIFYQSNWKVSSNWDIDKKISEKVLSEYNRIIQHAEFSDVFKKSEFDQLIKQSEIDVIGMDKNNKIYTADIAFHEGGLSYGDKIETKDRVCKKLLRTYLNLSVYFPDRKYELIFASPKVNKATEAVIKHYFEVLNTSFANENVIFKYISNETFRDEIVYPTMEQARNDSDSNELFLRSVKLLNLFELVLDKEENIVVQGSDGEYKSDDNIESGNNELLLEFVPANERLFKQELIKTKKAKRIWFYSNKNPETDIWYANNFTIESNLRGNIFSTNKVRARRNNGLIKIKLEIIK